MSNRKTVSKPRTIPVGIRLQEKDAAKLREDAKQLGQTLSSRIVLFLRKAGAI